MSTVNGTEPDALGGHRRAGALGHQPAGAVTAGDAVGSGVGVAFRIPAGDSASDASNAPQGEVGSLQLVSMRSETRVGRAVDNVFDFAAQNYATMALAYARRINENSQASSNPEVTRLGSSAVGEILAWAGPGWIDIGTATGTDVGLELEGTVLSIQMHGLKGEVGGELSSGGAPVVLVRGTARIAECAAGLRTVCPAPETIVAATPVADTATSDVYGVESGLGGSVRTLHFDASGMDMGDLDDRGNPYDTAEHYYLVRQPHAGKPGKVLSGVGWRGGEDPTVVTSTPISGIMDRVATATLGVADLGKCMAATDCTFQKSDGYCLLDRQGKPYPRDLFVPLENELTSDGDQFETSWKQYLARAKEAGERADALGKEALAAGVAVALRREGAQEKLAEFCGVHGLASEVTFQNGTPYLAGADAALRECLSADYYERAYLGSCPASEAAGCACAAGSGDGCYTELKIVPESPMPPPDAEGCRPLANAVSTLYGTPDQKVLEAMLSRPLNTADRVRARISGLQFIDRKVGFRVEWSVVYRGEVIMDSEAATLWPGCLATDSCTSLDGFARDFNRMFGELPFTSLADIRWRVLGAISQLGRIGGYLSSEAFQIFVPQLRDDAAHQGSVLTMYPQFEADPVGDGHALTVGDTFATMPPGYLPSSGEEEVPPWLTRVRDYPEEYGLVFAKTAERMVVGDNLSKFDAVSALAPGACPSGGPMAEASIENANAWAKNDFKWLNLCGDYLFFAGAVIGNPIYTVRFLDGYAAPAHYTLNYSFGGAFVSFPGPPTTVPLFPLGQDEVPAQGFLGPVPTAWDPAPGESATFNYCLDTLPDGDVVGSVGCPVDRVDAGLSAQFTRRLLRPSLCSPNQRAVAFSNSTWDGSKCDASRRLGAALGLNCALQVGRGASAVPVPPPSVETAGDLPAFGFWLAAEGNRVDRVLEAMILEDVPKSVVEEVRRGGVGLTGEKLGEVGRQRIAIAQSLVGVEKSWRSIGLSLRNISRNVDLATLQIKKINNETQGALTNLALARLQVTAKQSAAFSSMISSIGINPSLAFFASVGNAISITGIANAESAKLGELEALAAELKDTNIGIALSGIRSATDAEFTSIQQSLSDIRLAASSIVSGISALRQSQASALHQLAVATGEAYYLDADGRRVDLPVNSVLDREYDVGMVRYENALDQAKYLAYIARKAIEQRLLVKLGAMHTPVGPLEAPAKWADDLCATRGIRYDVYSGGTGPDGERGDGGSATDVPSTAEFEKQAKRDRGREYIGDYVAKLQTLVDYYNVAYPAHEGDDQTVISLRDDAVAPGQPCVENAKNLLLYSSDLTAADVTSGVALPAGWSRAACELGRCLHVQSASTLEASVVPGFPAADTTWLHALDVADAVAEPGGAPPASVWQEVSLSAGRHVLSFSAQSRSAQGGPATELTASTVYVGVYADDWTPLAIRAIPASAGTPADALAWTPRSSVVFDVESDRSVRVSFAVGGPDGGPGSVIVGNPQLERTADAAGTPSPYRATSSSRTVFSDACSVRTARSFQSMFKKKCDGARCFYDLESPLVIDTRDLRGHAGIDRRLAAGNFNYRNLSLAFNLVGTGALDCSREGPDCYGNSFVSFDMEHSALQVPLVGWDGDQQVFNFGTGHINGGRVLAAERVMTVPVSSGDQGLLSQLGIEKGEFRGRPLDGTYRLRLHDRPALVWSRVEDLQLVLKYRYWSPIGGRPGGG